MVYRQSTICRQTQRPTFASRMQAGPVSASKPKFWYLHWSWFQVVLVLHLSGASQSGLPWGVLPPALDGSWISRHIIHRWYWSWGGAISNSGHGFICFALLHIGIDGRQIVPMQGLAVPLPIPGPYHINWHIGIGLLFHNIFPIFPSVLNFVVALEGGYTD